MSAFTVALSLRSRVQGEPTIVALANQFLLALVLSATNTAEPSALEEVYRRSVPRLPGLAPFSLSTSCLCHLISRFICGSENVEAMSVLMTESHDLELQLTILALFYSAVHAGDRYSLKPLFHFGSCPLTSFSAAPESWTQNVSIRRFNHSSVRTPTSIKYLLKPSTCSHFLFRY
jgi:hypothetical protein